MQGGSEWYIDAQGCAADRLSDLAAVRRVCESVIEELGLHVLGQPQWHQFPEPAGVTGMYLLSESHLTVHTFPESQFATFNLYCCRPKPDWPWEERLVRLLGAEQVTVRWVQRSATQASASEPLHERIGQ